MRIGIDLMGGDTSPLDLLLAFNNIDISKENFDLTFFCTQDVIQKIPKNLGKIVLSEETIHMEDDPLFAIRRKKNSSLCNGIFSLKKREIDAFITMGNTGALTAATKMYLPFFEGISRPALLARLPTKNFPLTILDVGANVLCSEKHLIEFAFLGIAFQKASGIDDPKVGLLNIGKEAIKGREEHKKAFKYLCAFPFFKGNIEGAAIFNGNIHVLITDGFTGNIFLKTSEGISSFLFDQMHLKPPFPIYPGALLCGAEDLILKCHGNASGNDLLSTLQDARFLFELKILRKMKEHFKRILTNMAL